ncbi:MAG: YlbF family regulator [Methylacidiphilales bacterium]|nr:YlbF family regulator [Candidatus Methylacidiphilales bacterium]
MIQTADPEAAIQEKTKELCALILALPHFHGLTQDVKAFLDDEKSQEQYRAVSLRGRELHEKQKAGGKVAETEVGEFEKMRFSLMENPVARNFIEAQGEMNRIQDSINRYLSKCFELGRVPEASDFESEGDCCGGGCDCK